MKFVFLLAAAQVIAFAQSDFRNTVTLSAGSAWNFHTQCCQTDTAASLGITYGYRILPHLEAEAGVTTALNPGSEVRGGTYDFFPSDRFIWVPFGVRGILPLRNGRFELSAGGGGLYEKYSISNPNLAINDLPRSGWGGYFVGGAAFALGGKHRFWIGSSPHWYLANTNHGFTHDRWVTLSVDLSYRF